VDAHRSIALVAGAVVKREEVVSRHFTTVSVIRTIVDVLGIESPGLNDALAEPMAAIFNPYPQAWSYAAEVPAVLYTTALPLPVPSAANLRPFDALRTAPNTVEGRQGSTGLLAGTGALRTADYWERAMAAQNFEREDDLATDLFNQALWIGLRGEDVPYPHVRHGKDMRRNRERLLALYHAGAARSSGQASTITTSSR